MNLPFLFTFCINPDVLWHLPSMLLLPSAPFILVHPLFWCVVSSPRCCRLLLGHTWFPSINASASFNPLGCCCLMMMGVDTYLVVGGLVRGWGRVNSPVELDGWFVILNDFSLRGPQMRVYSYIICWFLLGGAILVWYLLFYRTVL